MSSSSALKTFHDGAMLLLMDQPRISDEDLKESKGYHIKLSSTSLDELDSAVDDGTEFADEFTAFVDAFVEILPGYSGGGLICFDTEERLYVCNPFTQEFLKLPDPSPCKFYDIFKAFGYLPLQNEYKIARLFKQRTEDNAFRCEIYTLGDGSGLDCWRVIEDSCSYPIVSAGVLANGAFHWMVDLHHWKVWPNDLLIVSLDAETETFSTLPPPPDDACYKFLDGLELATLAGSLCLADNGEDHCLKIWMLKDRENQLWVKAFNIYVPSSEYDSYTSLIPTYEQDDLILVLNEEENSLLIYESMIHKDKVSKGLEEG